MAPSHVLVKYRDDQGKTYNMEATSGGNPVTLESYRKAMPMTDAALKSGIYMQPLTKRETAVAMMETLVEFYGQQGWQERRIALADFLLKYSPKNVALMLAEGSAYAELIKRNFVKKYPDPRDIPLAERTAFSELTRNNNLWYDKAEALGWRQPGQESEARYVQTIKRAASAQQNGN